ncbi:MAG: hypothetical protein K0R15_1414 [Clostridiales bacterium]|nr:hypothetical protein [Clostridiales bacterium]
MKKALIAIWIIYVAIIVFALLPYKVPQNDGGKYGVTRLLIRDTGAFNAEFQVLNGEEELKDIFVNEEIAVETNKLILTGNVPSNKLSKHEILNRDIIVKGRVIGKTEMAPGSGYVVEYQVESWGLTSYMPMVIGINGDVLSTIVLFEICLFPVLLLVTIIILLKKMKTNKTSY